MQPKIDAIRAGALGAWYDRNRRYREEERERSRQSSRHNNCPWRGDAKARRECQADLEKILGKAEAEILGVCAAAGVPDWFDGTDGARPDPESWGE